jgi:hypothetical protein
MNEDFVSFELAKRLQEKGFKQKCLAYYDAEDNVGLLYNTQYTDEALPCQYTDLLQCHNTGEAETQSDDSENCVDAPTISQVLKWLREEKKRFVVIHPTGHVVHYYYTVHNLARSFDTFEYTQSFATYEQAAIEGIEYVIDNLI